MSNGYLLDSSTFLALIGNEPGADRLHPLLASSAITAINLAEVVKKLRERGVPRPEVEATIADIQIPIEAGPANATGPADAAQAIELGDLAAAVRSHGLSMGDAVCLATAARSKRTAVTTEKRWQEALPNAPILTLR